MRNKLLQALLLTSALVLPAVAAHAQTVTVTSNPSGSGSAAGTTRNTPGATVVGGVIEVVLTDYDSSSHTPSVSDASGNTYSLIEGPISGSDSSQHAWLFRAPVTTASGSAEQVSVSGNGSFPSIAVIYLAPPTGYTFGGVDCHNHGTADSGTLSVACTTTQANDLVVGGGGVDMSGPASGTTSLQNDTSNTGGYSGYNQPSTSGSHSIGFTINSATGDTMAMLAEKVTAIATMTQCGSSISPAYSSGKYLYQCQLSANLTVNNPTGASGSGGDSFQLELVQPTTEPGTHYTVTMGTGYFQDADPGTNTLTLSTTASAVDEFYGVSWPAVTNGPAAHTSIGAGHLHVGN